MVCEAITRSVLGGSMTGMREQKRHAWRAVGARLAALGLLLLMLPLTSCVCCPDNFAVKIDGWPTLGAILPAYIEPLMFANEYTEHVRAADGTGGELLAWQDKRYAKNATIPDISESRARIKLPAAEDVTTDNCPLRNMRVELNVRWYTAVGHQFEVSLFERVSPEGYMPILKLVLPAGPEGDEAVSEQTGPPAEYPVEYRHTISIGVDQLLLTFELWGTDPQTGKPAGERHVVKFRSFALFGLEDADVERRGVDAPCFLVTSHTIETLPLAQEQ